MARDEVLAILREVKNKYAEQYGILDIGVFGSVARDEAREDSDIDICIKMATPNPFAMIHVKEIIEELSHKQVDIVRVRERMNSFLRERIDKEAYYV
jgi:predicted nucleotidyltransferase